jgi:CTP:molybdopterin cytidylyltransferase MocA
LGAVSPDPKRSHVNDRIQALILAAGASTRLGQPKALAKLAGGQTLVARAVSTARLAGVEVAAVVREGEPDVAREATAAGAALVEVLDAEAGLSASLRAGVRAKSAGADALLVVLVDQWGLTPQDLTRLVKAWQQNGRAVVASAYSDVIGVPAIFGRGWFHVLERSEERAVGKEGREQCRAR